METHEKQNLSALVEKVKCKVNSDPQFSAEDMKAINEMLQAWRGWVALGRAARWLVVSIGLAAGAVASWGVLIKALKTWAQS